MRTRRNPKGVTLLELIAVLAILAIAVTMSGTYLQHTGGARRTRQASEQFFSDVLMARSAAVARGRFVCVSAGSGMGESGTGYAIWVENIAGSELPTCNRGGDSRVLADVTFPSGAGGTAALRFVSNTRALAFDPRGFLIATDGTRTSHDFVLCEGGCATGDMRFTVAVNAIGLARLNGGRM